MLFRSLAGAALVTLTVVGNAQAATQLTPRDNSGAHTGVTVAANGSCSLDFRVWLTAGTAGTATANVEGRTQGGAGLFTGSSAVAACRAGVTISWRRVDADGNGVTGFVTVGLDADEHPDLRTVPLQTGAGAIELTVTPEHPPIAGSVSTKTYDVP